MSQTQIGPTQEQLALLSRTIRDIARAQRLSREDADDFAQSVQVRCLERDYDIFFRFEGRSSLRTYLVVVISRMLLDWRDSMYGKWRPSAAAVSMGEHAVAMERLVSRDGRTSDEAAECLQMQAGAPPAAALRRLWEQLPARAPRRRMVSEEALRDIPGAGFEDPLEAGERQRTQRHIRAALRRALGQLSPDDAQLIRARYLQDRSVRAVAESLQTDQKALYRRYDRVLRTLRDALATCGVEQRMA